MQEPANFMRHTKHANMHLTEFNAKNGKKQAATLPRHPRCLSSETMFGLSQRAQSGFNRQHLLVSTNFMVATRAVGNILSRNMLST